MPSITRERFVSLVAQARERHRNTLAVPLVERLLSDQLTPVLAYRRLVAPDERTAPSFLLESVEGGERQGRHSLLGARPLVEVTAFGHIVSVTDHRKTGRPVSDREGDPLLVLRELSRDLTLLRAEAEEAGGRLPDCALGGWFGFASYDTVRYAEPEKLTRDNAPPDDRKLPDMHFGLYPGIVVFDHVDKLVHVVQLAMVAPGDDPGESYDRAVGALRDRVSMIEAVAKPMASGRVEGDTSEAPAAMASNMTRESHRAMVEKALRYIRAGDIFQVVLGQRFEKRSPADPFEVYRSLRAVNPSPYMTYLQGHGCILVASSPEILCRVHDEGGKRVVTNRPLAGTRKRGATPEADAALEAELLADEKERAEHIMLVDLGRNDVGKVAQSGSVELDSVMSIERYSHVMHISSTVTGELREGMDCWDALRAALPVGTISGAPKVRAMQIIDELEPVRRGPYGGGFGHAGLDGQMDIALALRTIVVPTDLSGKSAGTDATDAEGTWVYHIQAAGGIVADSDIDAEYEETVNKAAALARAIEVAERAFRAEA
ncbi:MAG: anthranilate synthase component I [Planctomycetota bacterium]